MGNAKTTEGEPRACAFEKCDNRVPESRGASSYCSDKCRYDTRNLKTSRERAVVRANEKTVCNRRGCSELLPDDRKKAGARFCCRECHDEGIKDERKVERAKKREGKVCVQCGKPLNAKRSTRSFCSQNCIDKFKYAADPQGAKDRAREGHLKLKYNMTPDDYEMLLAGQGGACAICLRPPDPERRRFAVDHDHGTGEVRGILCRGCNLGIAQFQEDTKLIIRAVRYVEAHR